MANDFSSWFTTLEERSHGRSEQAVALRLVKHLSLLVKEAPLIPAGGTHYIMGSPCPL